MSRSGYDDDCDGWSLIRWRGAVKSAMRGARGQAFFKDLAAALDAMPVKRLIAHELQTAEGEFCTIGVLGAARGVDLLKLDPDEPDQVAKEFGIASALAKEVVFENDECSPWYGYDPETQTRIRETPEGRWFRMRAWVESNIAKEPA